MTSEWIVYFDVFYYNAAQDDTRSSEEQDISDWVYMLTSVLSSAPSVLPFNRKPQFTGRDDILNVLHGFLENPERNPSVAIYGLGGCGKSAIAIEFAHQIRDKSSGCHVLWVSAFTVERFQESYREIARALQIPNADDLEQDMLEPVRRKLSEEVQEKWLMIVDNADDKGILYDCEINAHRLYDYLPLSRHGMILFTTRSRKVAIDLAPDYHFEIDMLKPDEAKDLLRKSLESEKALYSEDKADEFLKMLTYLPLAMSQAVAYMKKNRTAMERYMTLFQETHESTMEILEENFHDPNRARESRNAVAATLLMSFQRIEHDDKLAAEYLAFSACIAPQNVPQSIFPPAPSAIQQEKAIGTLTGYAFLTERTEKDFYDIHPLVHHVTRGYLKQSGVLTQTAQGAIERLEELIPAGEDERDKRHKEYPAYLSHGLFTADIKEIEDEEATIDLLDDIGRCYQYLGEYNNAVLTHRKAVIRRERTVGLQNERTLESINELGLALGSQGNYDEAEKLHKQGLSLKKETLGAGHPDTLVSMANLATIHQSQGRYDEAETLVTQVLEIRKTKLGGNHLETLTSMSNLASIYWNQGRYEDAETLEIEVLKTRKTKLGSDHPDTLTGMVNLASTYRNQGRYKEAEALDIQGLKIHKSKLGSDHPDTLTSMSNLASTYWNQGRYEEAEALEIQVLEIRKTKLGADHPDTLRGMNNLAHTWKSQGRHTEALGLMNDCLQRSQFVLGSSHPDTETTLATIRDWNSENPAEHVTSASN